MTDRDALFRYRILQAEETITEAERMLEEGFSPRSIINRAYYSMFYALLALFIKTDTPLKTSKHTGAISLFDRDFVRTGKFPRQYSKTIHEIFDARQEGDYREYVHLSHEDASQAAGGARAFVNAVKDFTQGIPD